MKKKWLFLAMLLLPLMLYANSFIGKWEMELVGASNSYVIEFLDDTTYSLLEVNENSPQYSDYTVDEKNQIISLGKVNNEDLSVKYSFNKAQDSFSLFIRDEMIDEQIFQSMGLGTTENETMTSFTKDFMERLKAGFKDLLRSLPIAIGKKIK